MTVRVPRGATYRVSGETASGDRTIAPGIEDDSSPRDVELTAQSGDTEFGYSGDG